MAIKQRRIKPGHDYTYATAQLCIAAEAIAEGDLVYISGYTGSTPEVSLAQADAVATARGRMLVAKHAIPNAARGICLPWQVIEADTSSLTADAPVFLSATTAGSYVETIEAATVVRRQVGTVLTSATAGKLLLDPNAASDMHHRLTTTSGLCDTVTIRAVVAAGSATTVDCPYAGKLIDAWLVVTTGGSTENLTITDGTNTIVTIATGTVSADDIVRASAIDVTYEDMAAGDDFVCDFSGATLAGIVYITVALTP